MKVSSFKQLIKAFEAIFSNAPISILVINERGEILAANTNTEFQYGYQSGELVGQSLEILMADDSKLKYQQLIADCKANYSSEKSAVYHEMNARKKGGDLFPIELSLKCFRSTSQKQAIIFLKDISRHKQAELLLYEDEQRLRNIIQSITEAFMGFTNDWKYLYINDKALSILGKSRSEVLGKSIWEIFPYALGEPFELEFRKNKGMKTPTAPVISKFGSTWWEVRTANYDGGMALLCSDITEATDARAALQNSEEEFSVTFNSSPSAISISELDTGIITDINYSHSLLFGFSKQEMVGKTALELGYYWNKDDRQKMVELIKKNGPIRNFETIAHHKNGNRIYLMVSADIIHLAKNKYLLTSSTDISINKKAMEELKSSKERFSKAFKASPVALSISTLKDGRMIEVNKTFLELFGFTMEEVIGRTAGELNMYPNTQERKKTISQLLEQGYIRNKELVCNTKKNGQIDVIFSMEMIELHGEDCIITTALNITDQKRAEEKIKIYTDLLEQKVTERTLELTQALEREKEVSDMKSRFVSLASHEFRTPLSTILSSTYLLEQSKEDDFDKTKHFNRIRSSVKNLTFILTEFLSLDKLEQRKVSIENETFDLETLASEVIDEVRIAYRLPIPLDYQHFGPSLIYQDKRIIRNILLNLISNAAKYSSNNQPITIRTHVDQIHLKINVIDRGIGIPKEDQKNIFKKFFRAHNTNHIQGTGLGLSIVKKYIELLEGSIYFKSTVGEGTEFEITLPIRMPEETPIS